eukprot:scaffold43737_cov43-Phaeocystis_antarctica.AAC.2
MYVPELVLRQFVSGRPPTLPKMVSLQGAVLFADVSGFTQLTAKLHECATTPARGAEELNAILSEYFDLLITCFHAHGGDVVSFSGDAMTVLFEADEGSAAERSVPPPPPPSPPPPPQDGAGAGAGAGTSAGAGTGRPPPPPPPPPCVGACQEALALASLQASIFSVLHMSYYICIRRCRHTGIVYICIRCAYSAYTVRIQCAYSAHTVHMQCTYTCSAHAVHTHTQCTCSAHAHAVHTQCTRSRCAPAAQYKAPALTSSQAVRCASAVLEVVRGFSLDGFAQGALSECTITLHAGMGVGQLSVLYVGGGNQRHKYGAEHAAQPSVLQVPQGAPGASGAGRRGGDGSAHHAAPEGRGEGRPGRVRHVARAVGPRGGARLANPDT